MIELERIGDVTRIHMWTRASRALGYSVSAFLARGMLIDTGFPLVGAELDAVIERTRPRGVMLTHWHEDHAGNVDAVARRGLPVAAAAETMAALRSIDHVGLYRRAIWGTMRALVGPLEPLEPDGLTLVHTPGHSHDHHVVWDAGREMLFAGDLFLGVKVRVAHRDENPRLLARSVRAAASLGPRVMFDAHRGLVKEPTRALVAKADWLDETIENVDRLAAEGWSNRAITRTLLGREDAVYYASRGGLSRLNFVRAVRAVGVRSSATATTA